MLFQLDVNFILKKRCLIFILGNAILFLGKLMSLRYSSMKVKSRDLISRTVSVDNLTNSLIENAFKLYQNYYEQVSFENFKRDLYAKDKIILIFEKKSGTLRGFSTLLLKNFYLKGKEHRVIFSGDTIIDERYRGTRALTREFFKNITLEKLKNPFTPVVWYLISKGYKTYLLLANNYNKYYPRYDEETPEEYKDLLNQISFKFYPKNYCATTGVIKFQEGHERLKDFTAPVTEKMLAEYPKIRFFVEKNSSWQNGDELSCIGFVNWSLMVSYPFKLFKTQLFRKLGILSKTTV